MKNLPVNPSGPGTLSEGSCLMVLHTSSSVMGLSSDWRSCVCMPNASKVTAISVHTCAKQVAVEINNHLIFIDMISEDLTSEVILLMNLFLFMMPSMDVKQGCVGITISKPADPWSIPGYCPLKRSKHQCFLRHFFSHSSESKRGLLSWAISSWCRSSLARASWDLTWPIFFWLHPCCFFAITLSLVDKFSIGHMRLGTEGQASSTVAWKPSKVGQNGLKWNLLFLQHRHSNPESKAAVS